MTRRERWARAALVFLGCVAAVVLLALGGCWSDPAAMEACSKLCNGRVKQLSSNGCVCLDGGDGGR